MCGIVGYVGTKQAAPFLIEGLTKLEYRGYDSAGIAVFDGEKIRVEKSVGRLACLTEKIRDNVPQGVIGIGHTRWATHEQVEILLDTEIQALQGDGNLEALELLDKQSGKVRSLPVDGLFVNIGVVPNTAMFAPDIDLSPDGRIMEPFIKKCRESVWKYKGMWEEFSDVVGFWADM